MTRIPATIVTGFLGAGKTTLLRHLVKQADRRIALVINEFGSLGIDRELLLGCDTCAPSDVVELANGCICCAVADDFLPAIEGLLAREAPPEHIVVETSGLALPKPLIKAFAWPTIRTRITVDGVIAVIDAAAFASGSFAVEAVRQGAIGSRQGDHDNPLEEVFSDQLNAADLVVLNKLDLVDARTRERLERDLEARLRRGAKLLATRDAVLPVAVALGIAARAEDDLATRPSHADALGAHDHDDFESFPIDLGPIVDVEGLRGRIAAAIAAHDVLRVKGFVAVPGRALRLAVQATGARIETYFDRAWRGGEPRESRLVVIGRKPLDQAAIATALAARAGVRAAAD
jgi:cobalamin biosynthesis protein CobW